MKLRWSHKDFTCNKCRAEIKIGQLVYLCKCCDTQLCKVCGDHKIVMDDLKLVLEGVLKGER